MLHLLRKEKFGSSSEKTTAQMEGKFSLFNEAEVEMNLGVQEPFMERKDYIYKRRTKTNHEELLKDLLVEEVPCRIQPDDMLCDQGGSSLRKIGYVKVRGGLEYIPVKVKVMRYM